MWLWADPSPGSSVVVGVEVTPESPSSALGQLPVPKSPGSSWSGVHPLHVVAVLELGEFGMGSPVVLAELVSGFEWVDIVSSDWWGNCENSTGPTIVVSSVGVLIWSINWRVVVEWSVDDFVVNNAKNWKLVGAWDVTFNWITAIAPNSSCPTIWFNWPLLYLISHTLLDVVEEVGILFFTNLLCNAQRQE